MKKLTIHIILNSHLDPVWRWTWPQGVDEALNTARTNCDLLDEYPEICITRGEAWFYDTVRRLDPKVFARMKRHVKHGRLAPIGGWWIQPDCNLPSAVSFLKQAEVGKKFFREVMGVNVTVGYNVDSFGHAATLPDFLRASGYDSYIMMRPGKHEKALPSNTFLWESPAGKRVMVFRISDSYTTHSVPESIERNVKRAIEDADRQIGHTMCFVGAGDHGGGPTRAEIEWFLAHRDYAPGVELKFSHPRAFFDAVKASRAKLPVVKDELQFHAIGCYSVVHEIKQQMRRAEELVEQAECIVGKYAGSAKPSRAIGQKIEGAWRSILFNQFHDILAGSSIRSAYDHALDELGSAKAACREIIVDTARREAVKLAPCAQQQLLFINAAARAFSGYVEFEPWLGYAWAKQAASLRLMNEDGSEAPAQLIRSEAACAVPRFVTYMEIPAGGKKILRICSDHSDRREESYSPMINFDIDRLSNAKVGTSFRIGGLSALVLKGVGLFDLDTIRVAAINDPSDTWSHSISGYGAEIAGEFKTPTPWRVCDQGPLRITLRNEMQLGGSTLLWQVYLQGDEPIVRIRLRVNWNGRNKILKLLIPLTRAEWSRVDGIPGGRIERKFDSQEYPVFNFVSVAAKDKALAIVSRDIYAADAQPDNTLRLTLLRSPAYAFHDPDRLDENGVYPFTDQGVHEYEIALMPMQKFAFDAIEAETIRQTNPIWMSETTKGMPKKK
ncbi:MAG: hypothetical protein NTX50_08665 [Candidatus Sumerlaeota bacterium]|nr:hypothetical protein [Candidatus Sumerlaeota bacterium]